MKIVSAFLVAFLAIGNHAQELPPSSPHQQQHPQQTPPGVARQGRSFPDFLAPFRGIFGRPRGGGAVGVNGGVGSAKQLYGVKPAASETTNSKPNSPYGGGDSGDGFRPSFPNFNDPSSSAGFGSGGGDYGPPQPYSPPKSAYGKPSALPSKHRPYSSSSPPHSHSHPHHPPPHHLHPYSHPGGPHGGPPHGEYSGQGGSSSSGPYSPHHAAQQQHPQTYSTYSSEPQQHHSYFGGGEGGPPQYTNEVSGPPSYDHPSPHHHHGGGGPPPALHNFHQEQHQQHDGPQPAQQFNRPLLSRPIGGPGGKPPGGPQGFGGPQAAFGGGGSQQSFGGGFDQGGFGDFGSGGSGSTFGGPPSDFGLGGGNSGNGGPQQQGSNKQPIGQGFFGGPEEYPEQYDEQTRNTREPEIITADYLQSQGQFSHQGNGFDDGYYSGGAVGGGGPASANSNPSNSHFGFVAGGNGDSGSGGFGGPGGAGGSSGQILRSPPLRSSSGAGGQVGAGSGSSGASGASSSGRPHFHAYGSQEESRRQPYLYRPVSSSIRVPGAVDEDAIYGKPMMMSASNKKPVRAAILKFKGAMPGAKRPMFKSAPHQQSDVVQLESPKDPNMVNSASYQHPAIMEPDTAASGHGHGHHGGGHGLESSNGDRILYHVSGHQGPYSYRFGYDTGAGYNRQFRFEEKDGKGYVTGKYGFYDKHGKLNIVKYNADPKHGFHAERDHGHIHQTHHVAGH